MKLARVRLDGEWRAAAVVADDSAVALLPPELGSTDQIVRGGAEALEQVRRGLARAAVRPLSDVELGAPLARFNRDVLCVGWNYLDHFHESKGLRAGQDPPAPPEHPTFFTKGPDTVVGPVDDIAFDPDLSRMWDYEAEMALVIGASGRSIPEETAMSHVLGFCVANDVSQRDLQRAHGGQWLKGKSIDGTMPIGPWLTTADEVDCTSLRITLDLNGQRMQDASTADMAFSIPRIIAELSRGMTLRPGDVVLTGTPSGIGNARDPQVFLQDGDVLKTTVSGLGTLVNTVRSAKLL
jgi:2-keto-4-pentenoate hydratase/2-oxohepta-3-ene-1,7-dioic acid hydratase in catechol pathway